MPLFRSDNQLRLLATLLLQPESSFTVTELARATHVSQPTVSREVSNLIDTGVLRIRMHRGRREISAETDSPIFGELSSLMLKTMGPKSVLEELLSNVAGIISAAIYGSWARRYLGEPGLPPTDIDVLVVGQPDVTEVRDKGELASERLGRDVTISILTEAEWDQPGSGFGLELRRAPIVTLELTSTDGQRDTNLVRAGEWQA